MLSVFLPLNCNWIASNLLPKFNEKENLFVEPYLPNYKIGIIHLARDHRDMNRAIAPLVCLKDATLVDTSNIPFGSLKKEIIEIVEKKYKSLSLGSSKHIL